MKQPQTNTRAGRGLQRGSRRTRSMAKFILRRLAGGILSLILVVTLVMVLLYVFTDRDKIFGDDPQFKKQENNAREVYKYTQWDKYGYLTYVPYTEYLSALVAAGEMDEATRAAAAALGRVAADDSEVVSTYVAAFTDHYEARGYTVRRLDAKMLAGNRVANGGTQQLFAYKDISVVRRLFDYFRGLFFLDSVRYVPAEEDIGERGLNFTLYDPVYNTEAGTGKIEHRVFSPAVLGNGTRHKYLFYVDSVFPYLHQNFVTLRLGVSYSVNRNVDVFDTMVERQGAGVKREVIYPTGAVDERSDDLHTATYAKGSLSVGNNATRFTDDYTALESRKQNLSRLGYSFLIGVLSSALAYATALPLGLLMARRRDKWPDKAGTVYILFVLACPALAYIFMVQALGRALGLPYTFMPESETPLMYLLPIISLAMPAVAGTAKWLRRYMIDGTGADYVKFARSNGFSEREIFRDHIFRNASIPLVQGVPAAVLGALVGAIITEKVYYVPGVGSLLTNAITRSDNAVIVGLTLFYAAVSISSVILGDILLALSDPRIEL